MLPPTKASLKDTDLTEAYLRLSVEIFVLQISGTTPQVQAWSPNSLSA